MKKESLSSLIGIKYNRLLIIGISSKTKKYANSSVERFVVTKCDCGIISVISIWQIKSNHTKSCGCLARESRRKNYTYEQAAVRPLLKSYKGNAKSRGYEFILSDIEFTKLIKDNCYYCNAIPPMKQLSRTNQTMHWTNEYASNMKIEAHGIDRIDNNLGYTLNNCVTCCTQCNYMKRAYSQQEFIEQCIRIANNVSMNIPVQLGSSIAN